MTLEEYTAFINSCLEELNKKPMEANYFDTNVSGDVIYELGTGIPVLKINKEPKFFLIFPLGTSQPDKREIECVVSKYLEVSDKTSELKSMLKNINVGILFP